MRTIWLSKDRIWNTEGIGQLDAERLTVKTKNADGTLTIVDSSAYELKVNNGEDDRYRDFTLKFNGKTLKGTEYVIEYPLPVHEEDLAKRYDVIRIGGNEISAETKDGGQKDCTQGHEFWGTKKIGKECIGGDNEKQLLKWKLTVNGVDDIAGKEVTDQWTKPEGVTAITLDTTQDIVIKLYDNNLNEQTITIKNGDNEQFQKYFKSEGEGFVFTVPSDYGDVRHCTVEYFTKIVRGEADENAEKTIENKGTFEGESASASGRIGGGGSQTETAKPTVTKTIKNKDGEYYQFKIEVKIPSITLENGFY